jgi:pentatricopeptide repeat protein
MKIIERHDDVTATHRSMDMQITTAITAKSIRLNLPSDEVLSTCTDKELRVCLRNCVRNGRLEEARRVATVMHARGIAKREDFKVFDWNHDSVDDALRPFKKMAQAVEDNLRKAWVETGGFARRAKEDPTKLWIDRYCGVKTPTMNAVFACHVKKAGDEPTFVLELNGTQRAVYRVDQLDEAFQDWCRLVSEAIIGLTDSHSSVQAVEAQLAAAA